MKGKIMFFALNAAQKKNPILRKKFFKVFFSL